VQSGVKVRGIDPHRETTELDHVNRLSPPRASTMMAAMTTTQRAVIFIDFKADR
jgi:hypothetical protein